MVQSWQHFVPCQWWGMAFFNHQSILHHLPSAKIGLAIHHIEDLEKDVRKITLFIRLGWGTWSWSMALWGGARIIWRCSFSLLISSEVYCIDKLWADNWHDEATCSSLISSGKTLSTSRCPQHTESNTDLLCMIIFIQALETLNLHLLLITCYISASLMTTRFESNLQIAFEAPHKLLICIFITSNRLMIKITRWSFHDQFQNSGCKGKMWRYKLLLREQPRLFHSSFSDRGMKRTAV